MPVRLASPDEAEKLWEIRNKAIRHGCKNTYDEQVILAWTPDLMPPGYRTAVASNPFFVVDSPEGKIPVATGYLDLQNHSVEAIFTLPDFTGKGYARRILDAIKAEAKQRGLVALTLSSTPNAFTFYQKNGFSLVRESLHRSGMAKADLRCIDMRCEL